MFEITQAITTDKSGEMVRSFWTIAQCNLMLLPTVSSANFRNSSPDCSGKATEQGLCLLWIWPLQHMSGHSFASCLSHPLSKSKVKEQQNDFLNVLLPAQNIFFCCPLSFTCIAEKKIPWNLVVLYIWTLEKSMVKVFRTLTIFFPQK